MRCAQCNNRLIQGSGSTVKIRIEGPLIFTGETAKAKCYWCKTEVELPLKIDAAAQVPKDRFVLKS